MSEKKIKVIDRRMFTPDGELRDEYRSQVDPERSPEPPRPVEPRQAGPHQAGPPHAEPYHAEPPQAAPRSEPAAAPAADEEEDPNAPKFGDLVGLLAQTGAAYIQQARATASPDLMQMAQLHVDLLGVLEKKTAGNLSLEEVQMLQDVKRQLAIALG